MLVLGVCLLLPVLVVVAQEESEATQRQPVVCQLPPPEPLSTDQLRCRAHMFSYSFLDGQCIAFPYGGCRGGRNRLGKPRQNKFMSKVDCEEACICTQPMARGRCRARMSNYYFNTSTRQCEPFEYSGCRGNQNNFKTQEECTATCATRSTRDSSVVRQIDAEKKSIIFSLDDN